MFPALPFGPLTLPTGPFFIIFAVYFGLDVAARSGVRKVSAISTKENFAK